MVEDDEDFSKEIQDIKEKWGSRHGLEGRIFVIIPSLTCSW
jgi:hypothetical protein